MAQDNDTVDFGEPLPPDAEDGHYKATVSIKNEGRTTKDGKPYAFIEFRINEALGDSEKEENTAARTPKVSKIFLPADSKDAKRFRSFMADVQRICKAAKIKPPSMKASETGNLEAWKDFLESLEGADVEIWVKNAKDKQGTDRCNVSLEAPAGKKSLSKKED